MWNKGLQLFAIVLVAAATYAQAPSAPSAPPAPVTPSAPPAVQSEDVPDTKEIQKEAEQARREAEQERRDAMREAERAQREAQREATKARSAARKAARAQVVMNRSYLGIGGHDLTPERANALKVKEPRGVEVIAVDQDSPAGKAGIKEHDVIISFDGKPLNDYEALRQLMHETTPGKVVKLGIVRNGSPMTVSVTVARRQSNTFAWAGPGGSMPPMPPMPPMNLDIPSFTVLQFSSRNGVVVEDITPQLGEFFGVKDGEGVLVRSVDRGSAAESSGLKAGDVIIRAGTDRISCSSDWRRALREHKSGNLAVGIVRDKREQNLTLKLPSTTSDAFNGQWPGFSSKDFEDLHLQLQKLQPQIQKELRIAQANVQREMKLHSKELEKARTLRAEDFEKARAEAEKALQQAMEELHRAQKQQQQQ